MERLANISQLRRRCNRLPTMFTRRNPHDLVSSPLGILHDWVLFMALVPRYPVLRGWTGRWPRKQPDASARKLQVLPRPGPQSHATRRGLYVAIRCQAVGVARKSPPSGDEWLPVRPPNKRASPSPAGGSKGPGDEGGDRATSTG